MDNIVRRTLFRLGAAYALAWATTSMVAGPGSSALVALTGELGTAGLFIAIYYVSSAAGAALGGSAMDRLGRRRPLMAAYAVSAAGFGVAGLGVTRSSLALFLLGTIVFAASFGTVNLTRLAAAEMFPPSERGRGVAWVQISAIFGAVTGPILLFASEPLGRLLHRPPLDLVWFLAPPLLVISAVLVRAATEPREIAERSAQVSAAASAPATAATAADNGRLVAAGVVSLTASQAAMAAVMGVAGAAVSHAGHGVRVLGGLMFLHFVGMFALSRVVGRVADLLGRRLTIIVGLGLLASGGAVVAAIPGSSGFGAGLLLVGFGWSFGFIGSTVLLTDVTPAERRAGTLGRADLTSQLASAVVAMGAGWWFASHGLAGLGVVAIAVAAMPLVLLGFVREEKPGQYAASRAR